MTRFIASALLTLAAGASLGGQPRDDAVDKLIAQLGSSDFRTRDQASNELVKLGDPILPALRKAALTKGIALETKRRIEDVALRIEQSLLAAEEKNWKELDEPSRGIRERVLRIVARNPDISPKELARAIYRVASNRLPTVAEADAVQTRLKQRNLRQLPILELTRTLVQDKNYNADIAAANLRVVKLQKDLRGGDLTTRIGLLNGPEIQKLTSEIAAALDKAAKTDEQYCELAFLVVLSRFPEEAQATNVVKHLKNKDGANRTTVTADIIWVLINTKEFIDLVP